MNKLYLLKKLLPLLQKEKTRRKNKASRYDWQKCARQKQLPPEGNWRVWLILAGRGFGKTRTGAETIRQWVREGLCQRIALIGKTEVEVRQVMVEGVSGLLSVHSPIENLIYKPTKRQLTWPNGAIATCYSAEAYERLRGSQFDGAWLDELEHF
ncbi:MAG: hypothetical protein BGO67_04970 [Alphaproteobacteria bacterium 41-28]|nr:MAG: hypothetical protein BGO67_04970 [Alphaproteobacteria bacterium 41-28]